MRTPWSTSGSTPPDRSGRTAREAVSSADGYAERSRRREAEQAARAALTAAAKSARDVLTARQRRGTDGGTLPIVARLEAVHGQLQWLLDRFGLPLSPGAWFDNDPLPSGAAAWLAAVDARLAGLVAELAATVAGADDDAVADAADATVAELRAQYDARRDVLRAATWSARPLPTGLAALMPFETVVSDGQPRRALEVMRYARGDVAVLLDDGVIVWEGAEQTDGARVAFDAAAGPSSTWTLPPPASLASTDDRFQIFFHDDGSGELHGPFGRRRVAAERWLLRGDAGGWLWLARDGLGADGAAAWRGVGVGVDAGGAVPESIGPKDAQRR